MSSTEQSPPEIELPGALPREQPDQQAGRQPEKQPEEQPDAAEQDTYGGPGEGPVTGDGESVNDEDLPLPNRPPNEQVTSDDLNGEVPD